MNKYGWLFVITIYTIVVTAIANSLELEYRDVFEEGFENPTNSIDSAFNFFKTFGKFFTWQLNGMPAMVNIILTVPIYVIVGAIIVSWIRGVD